MSLHLQIIRILARSSPNSVEDVVAPDSLVTVWLIGPRGGRDGLQAQSRWFTIGRHSFSRMATTLHRGNGGHSHFDIIAHFVAGNSVIQCNFGREKKAGIHEQRTADSVCGPYSK